jgi:hypothetical protein
VQLLFKEAIKIAFTYKKTGSYRTYVDRGVKMLIDVLQKIGYYRRELRTFTGTVRAPKSV